MSGCHNPKVKSLDFELLNELLKEITELKKRVETLEEIIHLEE